MRTISPSTSFLVMSNLLPSPYHIVYASLLLAFSVPVTFAGAFLTLDRTRSFAPSNSLSTTIGAKNGKFRLEGGVGGLLGGWLVGVHASTLIALLIMNRTSATPLGSIQFLVVWLLPALAISAISGRWKLVAVPLIGLGGGVTFSLFVTVVCHPEKLARNILLGVCGVISTVLCLLPIPLVQHGAIRSASAWLGAFGIVMAISILSGVSDWSNVWSRLWVSWDSAWGTGQEKGLSAAFGGLAAAGIAVDWLLKRQFGENPDEKWDSYLANYAANLPNAHDRPGTFTPAVPFWKKIFNPQPKGPILFPPDKALLSTHDPLAPPPYQAGKLRPKGTKAWSGTASQPLKKSNLDLSSDSGSSSDEEEFGDGKRYIPRPWAPRKDTQATSLSGVTLADTASASSKGKQKGGVEKDLEKGGEVIYSDGEEVAASIRSSSRTHKDRDVPGWKPEFIKRHSIGGRAGTGSGTELEMKSTRMGESPPPGAVPVTPSLMRALDRVSQAQNEAYGGIISKGHTPRASTHGHGHGAGGASTPGVPPLQMPTPGGGYDWAGFWRTVEDKTTAAAPTTQPKPTR
ncbi:hypothetical protein M408DRAFT_141547 [Serendipita vermifera MAFF 305830]|uniref:DUF4203 domain-containing protein n=1 Tax=Serendipita vermifera MAFF 305830 TaxID=933852 RepID=A0A0C3B8J0_SERVB|nr:hypothetical protein M408DRAFT_141547 [Serendipita vermifera MAFF 305830]